MKNMSTRANRNLIEYGEVQWLGTSLRNGACEESK